MKIDKIAFNGRLQTCDIIFDRGLWTEKKTKMRSLGYENKIAFNWRQ